MLIWAQREIQLFWILRPYYHKGKRLSDRRNGHMTNTILISNDNIDDCENSDDENNCDENDNGDENSDEWQ